MLPRRQRSIFHLGEEGGDDDRRGGSRNHAGGDKSDVNDTRRHSPGGRSSHGGDDALDAVVGLRILVTHQNRHHARASSASRPRILLKQMVLPAAAAAPHGSFLTACSLCRRELSPDKDVYMYRGDQGFCSEECRWRQILVDEARERDAMIRKQRRGLSVPHHHGPRSAAAAAHGGPPRRLLAVA